MTLRQTNQAIKLLRSLAQQGPLPVETHEQITKTLLDLLRQKEQLSK